jgi:hypothetical protein
MISLVAQLAIMENLHFREIKSYRRDRRNYRVLRRLRLL